MTKHTAWLSRSPLQRKHCANSFSRHNVGAMYPRTVGRLCQTPIDFNSAFHKMKPSGPERHRRAARETEGAGANDSNAPQRSRHANAFTLIELLVVIAIIAILIGLFFPAFSAVQNQARKAQAKNDLTQIITAVNAFYTDYGRYPTTAPATSNVIYGPEGAVSDVLFNELQACHLVNGARTPSCCTVDTAPLNTRQIVFLSPRCSGTATARSGIGSDGQYYDSWGTRYNIEIDADYNNQIANPYPDTAAGAQSLGLGVIGWSYGKDQTKGTKRPASPNYGGSDDVISWQ